LADTFRFEEALATDRAARAAVERVLGPQHPFLVVAGNIEGEVLNSLGRHDEARAACQLAIDVGLQAGSDKVLLSFARTCLGIALRGLGRSADAIPPLEQALRTRIEKATGSSRARTSASDAATSSTAGVSRKPSAWSCAEMSDSTSARSSVLPPHA
jgi:hypothetical protein